MYYWYSSIFLNLIKALDNKVLISNLDDAGVRGVVSNIFRSSLSNRKQFVNLNGEHIVNNCL